MARKLEMLDAITVANKAKPGLYADGGGLYLQITDSSLKTWIFRFTSPTTGRRRDMGLGRTGNRDVTLAQARDKAAEARKLVKAGIDPIEANNAGIAARKALQDSEAAERAKRKTFKEVAQAYIAAHEDGWKNAKHAAQWDSTLATYVYPVFGHLPVNEVDTNLVVTVLEPIWPTKTETASRVRGRIEAILDYAAVRKFRDGENPARWKGHLDQVLPARAKVQKAGHHAALPYDEMGAFMVQLRQQDGTSARALEFAVLTAARTGETIGATWDEIDLDKRIWTIAADRMKAWKEHRVPLSDAALAVLKDLANIRQGAYVFPGARDLRPLSNMALLMTLRRMSRNDLTAHGFRSTFRDWAAERTNYPREVAEMALAHTIGDKVEAAYRRGDLFEKRTRMMQDWANFCARPLGGKGKVIPLVDRGRGKA